MRDRNAEAALLVAGGLLLAVLGIGQEKRLEWTLKPGGTAGKLHLSIQVSKPRHRWSNSSDVPLERFRGLPPDVFDRGGAVKFEYVHDAGRLMCEGRFSWSKGSGTFTFVPDPKFATELQRLGYEAPDSEQAFQMMLVNADLEFARGVKDAGLYASTRQLLDLRNHGMKLEYIHEMIKLGYTKLALEDYIGLRDHGVTTEFAADLKAAGYDLTAGRMIELRDHGLNSNFFRALQQYGLKPSASELVQLRDHGVTPEYLKELKDAGFEDLPAGRITEMKDHGISGDFVQEAVDLGYRFTPREMIELRDHGVNREYLRRVRDSGMKNLSASQIVKLKDHGVD